MLFPLPPVSSGPSGWWPASRFHRSAPATDAFGGTVASSCRGATLGCYVARSFPRYGRYHRRISPLAVAAFHVAPAEPGGLRPWQSRSALPSSAVPEHLGICLPCDVRSALAGSDSRHSGYALRPVVGRGTALRPPPGGVGRLARGSGRSAQQHAAGLSPPNKKHMCPKSAAYGDYHKVVDGHCESDELCDRRAGRSGE